MERHSASYPNSEIQFPAYLQPIRLVRAFRCNFRPIPYFLQDLLSEAPCRSCSENQSRVIDILKNIQTTFPFDEGQQGKLWFEIRRLLKKDVLSDEKLYSDGRAVRNHLLKAIENEEISPMSPSIYRLTFLGTITKKVEVQALKSPVGTLSLTRQTSK